VKYKIALIAIAAMTAIASPVTQSLAVLACINGFSNIMVNSFSVSCSAIIAYCEYSVKFTVDTVDLKLKRR
jgi:hypothetical protein